MRPRNACSDPQSVAHAQLMAIKQSEVQRQDVAQRIRLHSSDFAATHAPIMMCTHHGSSTFPSPLHARRRPESLHMLAAEPTFQRDYLPEPDVHLGDTRRLPALREEKRATRQMNHRSKSYGDLPHQRGQSYHWSSKVFEQKKQSTQELQNWRKKASLRDVATSKGDSKQIKPVPSVFATPKRSYSMEAQAFVNQTNFIGRWLKVENVVLKQASGAQNAQTARAKLFVIPTLAKTQVLELLKFILNSEGFDTPLNQINKRYILKTWLKVMSVPTILSLIMMLNIGSYPVWFLLLSGIVLFPLVYLRWRNFGYAINDNFATIRSGFFGFRRITFPLFKAQRVSISQSPMQKRKDLATLKIYLASDRIEIPYVPIEHAHAWFDQISYKIETTKQNWF